MDDVISKPDGEDVLVWKYGTWIRLSREQALDQGIIEPTDEERARHEAARVESRARHRAAQMQYRITIPKLDAITDQPARAVLDLHQRTVEPYDRWGYCCKGCDMEGYEVEEPAYPCRTTRLIAKYYGIELPDWFGVDRPEDGSLDARGS
jgi:hypothetical protein